MGNSVSYNTINYEDIQYTIENKETHILINTLKESQQHCLIYGTCIIEKETDFINEMIQLGNFQIKILIYGENSNDKLMYKKYDQLIKLGFQNIYLYTGGLFEWLLLQDIYGDNEFPTTSKILDILKYKGNHQFGIKLLNY